MSELTQDRSAHLLRSPKMFVARRHTVLDRITHTDLKFNYYSALYEFQQGHAPQIIWETGCQVVSDRTALCNLIVNTQTNHLSQKLDSPSIIMQSSFQNIYYIAVFNQILDAEARGFTRPIVLVLSCQNQTLLSSVYCSYKSRIMGFMDILHKNSVDSFPNEITQYASELKAMIEAHKEDQVILTPKFNELKEILNSLKISSIPEFKGELTKPIEYFANIHPDLRPIEQITNFNDVKPRLLSFINDLPASNVYTDLDILSSSADRPLYKEISNLFPLVSADYSNQSLLLSDERFSSNIIANCLFSLLSNQTLILVSILPSECLFFAKRLAALSPFDKPFSILVDKGDSENFSHYSIVVTSSEKYDSKYNYLNLETASWRGNRCPKDSIVFTNCSLKSNESEIIFLVTLYNDIKRISNRIFNIFEQKSAQSRIVTKQLINSYFKDMEFSKSDKPILKCHMAHYYTPAELSDL